MAYARKTVKMEDVARLVQAIANGESGAIAELATLSGIPSISLAPATPQETVSRTVAKATKASSPKVQKAGKRQLEAPTHFFVEEGTKPGMCNLYLHNADLTNEKSTAGYSRGTDAHTELMAAGFRWSNFFGRWYGAETALPDRFQS